MKNQIKTLVIAVSLGLASVGNSHAKSSLVSMSQEPMWPATSTPNGTLVYNVTAVGRAGSGLLEVALSGGNFPAGVTVTFSPSVLRFTGNQVTSQTATMTVTCPYLMPIDCYAFTITGTAQNEALTITNVVSYTPSALAVRVPTLMLDKLGTNSFKVRGAGASGQTYQIQGSASLSNPNWTILGPSTADGNGRFTFFPSNTVGSARFFRAMTTNSPALVVP